MSRHEIQRPSEPGFASLEATAPADSFEGRRGLEWLVLMRPRPAGPSKLPG